MTKPTMPRPVGHVTRDTSQADMDAELPEGTTLITTTQAEAYADARVREALEEAALIVNRNSDRCSTLVGKVLLSSNADAIRALMPPLSGPASHNQP